LTALDRLIGAPKDDAERIARARTALETALPGRQQWIRGATLGQPPHRPLPSLVLDGGHNREALFALGESLEGWGVRGYTLLVALLEDKMTGPVREPLAALIAGAAEVIGVTLPFPRAPEPAMLRAFLEGLRSPPADGSVRGLVRVTDPSSALALIAETPERPAVATGSLWMVGELLKVLRWPEGAAQPMPACAEVPTAGTEPGLTSGHPPSAQGSP
jgi:folylpolyglutamate synthase/dihydropteroate synthase